jgi:hypothetical protein
MKIELLLIIFLEKLDSWIYLKNHEIIYDEFLCL